MRYILSCSYGKDSLACIGACMELGWKIDEIVHAEVWATDDISADLPPMVEFKKKADKIIKDRWGIEVKHLCAMRGGERYSYEKYFYHILGTGKFKGKIKGFPMQRHPWCQQLKVGYGAKITESNLRKHFLFNFSKREQDRTDIWLPNAARGLVQQPIKDATTKFSKARK